MEADTAAAAMGPEAHHRIMPSAMEQAAIEAHAEALRMQGLRVDAAVLDAAFAVPIANTRRITVGELNFVVTGSAEGKGVPREVLDKVTLLL